jgi:Cytidylate kinase-like family
LGLALRRTKKHSDKAFKEGRIMSIIVLTSEMGTSVKHLAEHIGRRLGLPVCNREIVEPARKARCARADPHGPFGCNELVHFLAAQEGWESLSRVEEICGLAASGQALIVGSTAAMLLRDVAHVVRVRLRTTFKVRVDRIKECMGTNDSALASDKIVESDKRHSETLARLFGIADREDPALYDLVVDTGRDSIEVCAEKVIALTREQRYAPTPDSQSRLSEIVFRVHACQQAHALARRAGEVAKTEWYAGRARGEARLVPGSRAGVTWVPDLGFA